MRTQKALSPLLFYTILIVLFIVDLAAFSIFEKPVIFSLLCFYILQLSRPMGLIRIFTACILLSLSPLIQYGRFGLELVYVIPATLLGIKMRHTLYDSRWQYYALLAACLLAQIGLVEYGILHLTVGIPYTISMVFANLILIWIMSFENRSR